MRDMGDCSPTPREKGVSPSVSKSDMAPLRGLLQTQDAGASDTDDPLMTPGEVAKLFRVDPKTVTRWATAHRLPSLVTPGGHRRFRTSVVRRFLEEQ